MLYLIDFVLILTDMKARHILDTQTNTIQRDYDINEVV